MTSYDGKLPDERRRWSPKQWIIRQGLHPHPGPTTIYNCGFDDPDGAEWYEDDGEVSCGAADDGWPAEQAVESTYDHVDGPEELEEDGPTEVWEQMR